MIDLSGAFRLRDARRARSGIRRPAVCRTAWPTADRVRARRDQVRRGSSNPGCYPTASLLALLPLQRAGLLKPAPTSSSTRSRASRARQAPTDRTHFSENHGSVAAYKAFGHRHVAEMEQALGQSVTFVPHLVPLDRGIRRDDYAHLVPGRPTPRVAGVRAGVCRAPFVRVTGDALPEIKHVAHTNFCDVGWKVDEATGRRRGQRDRQPGEGRGRPGDPELQRDVRLRRSGGPAVKGVAVLKLGGELLENASGWRRSAAAIERGARRPRRWSSCTAAAARSTRRSPRRHRRSARWTASASPMGDAQHRRVGARGSINTRFVAAINAAGGKAVGLTGADAGVAPVKKAAAHKATSGETVDLGLVGSRWQRTPPGSSRRWCRPDSCR